MASNGSRRLAEVAEELAKAALAEAGNSSLAVGRETVASLIALKEAIDHKLNTNNQKLDEINKKLNTVNESMATAVAKVGQEVKELKDVIKQQEKFQRINFAIENFQYGSFDYISFLHESSNYGVKKFLYQGGPSKSSDLVKTILFTFKVGDGRYLPRAIISSSSYSESLSEEESKEREQKFRDGLVVQIFSLTGMKPRVNKEADGRYAIYYS